jgi:CTD small phosphatase-like protein 2
MEKINNNPLYILPQINDKKYVITLFINLDEVLSFYCENNNSPYVKIRSGGEKFLLDLSKYFEIIIFTESSKEYMDTILDNLNFHNNVISYRLYSEYFDNKYISDISLLNRNPCKSIIINPNNILKCNNNEIHIKPFMGDEKDKILFKLKKILFQYLNNNIEDIRNSLNEIQKKLDN